MPHKNWTYCQINFQILDDGRGFGRVGLGNRLMWIRFIAQSGNKTIQTSKKLPIPTIGKAPLAPQKGNIGQEQILQDLIESLKRDHWEVVKAGQADWWQVRLRKEAPFEKPVKPKLSSGELLTIAAVTLVIAILGVIGYLNFQSRNQLLHYTNVDLNSAPASTPPLVGSMVVIDFDTRELDPIQLQLPPGLAADDPQEAETVVWLDCETDSNWRGATSDCVVMVIDWNAQHILDERSFAGEFTLHPDPDDEDAQPIDIRDHDAIIAYLSSLPRK